MSNKNITERQNSIVIGLLLGDGYLYTDGRLQVEQSMGHEQYLKWLYSELLTLSGKLSSNIKRIHPKTGIPSFSCRFYTRKCFTFLEALFYKKVNDEKMSSPLNRIKVNRIKVVPSTIEQLLDPIVLAVWFMDDGGKAQNTPRAAYINATSFTSSERILLQQAVQNVFGLKINIQKAGGKNQYNFYIPASSHKKFCEIVLPTISLIPSMEYKLGDNDY